MFKAATITLGIVLIALAGCTGVNPSEPNPYGDGYVTGSSYGRRHPLPNTQNQPAPFIPPTAPTEAQRARVAAPPAKTQPRVRPQGLPGGAYNRVKLKILVIAAVSTEPELLAWQTFLPQIGVPFDTLIASGTDLTAEMLESEPGIGNYSGIIITNSGLPYNPGTGFTSALSLPEWNMLRQYEADYRVREVQYSGFPDGTILAWGGANPADANADTLTLSTDGQAMFPYLKANAQIPLEGAYTYHSTIVGDAKPLISSTRGIVAASKTWPDGRESLVMTPANNYYLMHSMLLSYGVVRWVTRGIFLGEKKMYFSSHIDDLFLANDVWDVTANANSTTLSWKMRPTDMQSTVNWQNSFRTTYPEFASFKFEWFFNGFGFNGAAVNSCTPPGNSPDPLSASVKCQQSNFYWGNHTLTHVFITNPKNKPWTPGTYSPAPGDTEYDSYSLTRMRSEVGDNVKIARVNSNGLLVSDANFDTGTLVTGSHSGLGYYDYTLTDNIGAPPDIPSPGQNEGKSKANPDLITAAIENGVHYFGANTSAPTNQTPNGINAAICVSTSTTPDAPTDCSQNNPSPNAGRLMPSGPGTLLPVNDIMLVPRYPVNIFYNTDTIARLLDEYNFIYKDFWTRNGHPADHTWAEILNLETNTVLGHIISGSMNPHYFHQNNLHFGDGDTGNDSLLTLFTQELGRKYSALLNLPVQTLKMTDIGTRMRARMAFDAAGAQGIWDRSTGTVTISAATNAAIPVTNPTVGDSYGPDRVTTLTAGQTITVGAGI